MQMPVQPPAAQPNAKPNAKPRLRPPNQGRRIRREKRTLAAMLEIYCRDHHGSRAKTLCAECGSLLRYAQQRLDNCVFGELKQSCNQCAAHCYSKSLRPRLLEVTGYAEPRLRWHYPLLGVLRLIDRLRAR